MRGAGPWPAAAPWAAFAIAVLAACATKAPEAKKELTPTYYQVDPATAGAITGKIDYKGRKPAPQRIRMQDEEDCMKAHAAPPLDPSVTVNSDGTLANVLVYIKSGLEGKVFEPVQVPVEFNQKGCMFEPRVLGIRASQPLRVSNSDSVTHNIHPLPRVNNEWNFGQTPGSEPFERKFTKSEGPFPVKCNVHAWMRAYFAVLDHPYYASTGTDGTFHLTNVPPGTYVLEAWHEKLPAQQQNITVGPAGTVTAGFTFTGE